jgi:hypothetical protein
MKAKHTPGPWLYQPCAGQHDFAVYQEENGDCVALVRKYDEANARLMAAAPDLLAACRDALRYLNNPEEFDGDLTEIAFATDLENAIRKATGGEV